MQPACLIAVPTACARLQRAGSQRAGCTAHEIAAITGHASLREVARYTRAADQRNLAVAAMAKVSKA
jgi:integrase